VVIVDVKPEAAALPSASLGGGADGQTRMYEGLMVPPAALAASSVEAALIQLHTCRVEAEAYRLAVERDLAVVAKNLERLAVDLDAQRMAVVELTATASRALQANATEISTSLADIDTLQRTRLESALGRELISEADAEGLKAAAERLHRKALDVVAARDKASATEARYSAEVSRKSVELAEARAIIAASRHSAADSNRLLTSSLHALRATAKALVDSTALVASTGSPEAAAQLAPLEAQFAQQTRDFNGALSFAQTSAGQASAAASETVERLRAQYSELAARFGPDREAIVAASISDSIAVANERAALSATLGAVSSKLSEETERRKAASAAKEAEFASSTAARAAASSASEEASRAASAAEAAQATEIAMLGAELVTLRAAIADKKNLPAQEAAITSLTEHLRNLSLALTMGQPSGDHQERAAKVVDMTAELSVRRHSVLSSELNVNFLVD
jgi:hypothetical protein